MSARLLVVGSLNVDLVVGVDALPGPDQTVLGGELVQAGGGKGANAAVAAARLGAQVTLVAAVGDDAYGRQARVELAAEGIVLDHLAIVPSARTGVALIVVDGAGENQIVVASGANASLGTAAVEAARDVDCDAVLVCFEVGDDAVRAAVALASAQGVPCVVDPAPARGLALELGPVVLTPNAGEACALSGESDPAAAARALSRRTGAPVLLTRGADGALLAEGDALADLAAPSARAVDTVGAGDTFSGALAVRLGAGDAVEVAARYALRAASLSVRAAGARGAMPTAAEVDGAASR